MAEGFDFQTLQTVQPRVLKVRDSSFVNRQLVRAEGFDFQTLQPCILPNRLAALYRSSLNPAEGLKNQTIQPHLL